jgi:hypothetical protein
MVMDMGMDMWMIEWIKMASVGRNSSLMLVWMKCWWWLTSILIWVLAAVHLHLGSEVMVPVWVLMLMSMSMFEQWLVEWLMEELASQVSLLSKLSLEVTESTQIDHPRQ